MFSGTFFGPVALLYYLCSLLLAGLVLFLVLGSRRPRARFRLQRTFIWLALSLLLWQLTLFLEVRVTLPAAQLWLGRANFTAVVFAAYLVLRFVQEVPTGDATPRAFGSRWLRAATGLLAAVTLLTRSAAETSAWRPARRSPPSVPSSPSICSTSSAASRPRSGRRSGNGAGQRSGGCAASWPSSVSGLSGRAA